MTYKVWVLIFCVVLITPAMACMGPDSEVAQKRDATSLFEGRAVSYKIFKGPFEGITSGSIAKIEFDEGKKKTTVLMRGNELPQDLSAFQKRFGLSMTVGARVFPQDKLPKDLKNYLFIVDAACSMKGEDWYLKTVK